MILLKKFIIGFVKIFGILLVLGVLVYLFYPQDQCALGIDVSHYNKNVEYIIEKYQPRCIIAKATQGTNYKDPTFNYHKKLAKQYHIPFGAYHFFSFKDEIEDQFENYKNCIEKDINIKPIIDVESYNNLKDLTYEEMTSKIKRFGELCYEYYGVYPIIYCDELYRIKYFLVGFDDYEFWTCNHVTNNLFPASIHQYKINKKDHIDLNKIYNFNSILYG